MMKLKLYLAAILAAAFLLTGCGANQGDLAGRINGQPVTVTVYNDSYRAHYTNFQVLNNRAPSRDERELLKQQTWTHAAMGIILRQYFTKYKISATNQEVVDTLLQNPPSYILHSPRFATNGVFDPAIYNQSLLYDTPENLGLLRQDYQGWKIPIMKLQQELARNELLNSAERKLIGSILQSRADINFTLLDLDKMEPWISPDEVTAHYRKYADKYRLDPFVSLSYATLEVLPTRTDIHLIDVYADSLYQELSSETPVEVLLQSSHPFASSLVFKNSGFIPVDELDPAVYAHLSGLVEGNWGEPQSSATGRTIYQLEKRTKSMCSFNYLHVPYLPSVVSIERVKPDAELAVKLAQSAGLAVACEEMSLPRKKVTKTDPASLWFPDPLIVSAILTQLPGQPSGHVFAPIYSFTERQWVIVELDEASLEAYRPLAEVETEIREILSRDKSEQLALQISQRIITGQDSPPPGATTRLIQNMTAKSRELGKSSSPIFYSILHRHLMGETQEAFIMNDKVWIPQVISVIRDKKIKVSDASIQAIFAENLPPEWFDEWMEQKLRQAQIVKYME